MRLILICLLVSVGICLGAGVRGYYVSQFFGTNIEFQPLEIQNPGPGNFTSGGSGSCGN